jgi:hypothetical protein
MAEALAVLGALSSALQIVAFAAKKTEELVREYQAIGRSAATQDTDLRRQDEQAAELGKKCADEAGELLKRLKALQIDPDKRGLRRVAECTEKATNYVRQRKEFVKQRHAISETNAQLATTLLQSIRSRQEAHSMYDGADAGVGPIRAALCGEAEDVDKMLTLVNRIKTERLIKSLEFDEITLRQQSIAEA